jgi:D-ribose pyranose/furanose isomerase RbsD
MKNAIKISLFLLVILTVTSCNSSCKKQKNSWKADFEQQLPLLGHRNWVLVVDKAFPLQSAAGMTVINTGEQLPIVLQEVMSNISKSTHVKPIVYTDLELKYITEDLSKGVGSLKATVFGTLKGFEVKTILHNEVFAQLDTASKLFQVVVLKTETVIPYSSVFIQLDCAYWDGNREAILCERMRK